MEKLMPDFSELLDKKAGMHKAPPAFPAGNYPGVVVKWEAGDNNQNKTPYLDFSIRLTGWSDNVQEDEKKFESEPGVFSTLDPSKKQLSFKIYTKNREGGEILSRLDKFLNSLGVGTETGKFSYREALPMTIGKAVAINLIQKMSQSSHEPYNEVQDCTGI